MEGEEEGEEEEEAEGEEVKTYDKFESKVKVLPSEYRSYPPTQPSPPKKNLSS